MDIKKITDNYSVAGQIGPEDVPLIAAMGFKSLICNRPDGEALDQTDYETIEQVAKTAKIQTRYIPIRPGTMAADDIAAVTRALEELPGPVLAYCRSGARSTTIFQAAQAGLR
ncbi:MAG: TIGR01244 family sulfur transferase [Paracoccaceae bacterium]